MRTERVGYVNIKGCYANIEKNRRGVVLDVPGFLTVNYLDLVILRALKGNYGSNQSRLRKNQIGAITQELNANRQKAQKLVEGLKRRNCLNFPDHTPDINTLIQRAQQLELLYPITILGLRFISERSK